MTGLRVCVETEWDPLEEAIVGVSTNVVVAQWNEAYHSTFGDQVNDWYRRHGGQRLDSFDPQLATKMIRQQDALAELLVNRGVMVHRVPDLEDSRDRTYLTELAEGMLSFPRDPLLVAGTDVIETSPKHLWRRRERFALRPIVDAVLPTAQPHIGEDNRPPANQWLSVPPPSTDARSPKGPFLEGGDVLLAGDEVYVGRSGYATDMRGFAWLQQHFRGRKQVTEVRLTRDAFHLDCALALLRPGLAVAYREAFVDGIPSTLADWDVIDLSYDEQQSMAANLLVLNEFTVICDQRHQRVIAELRRRGLEVLELPFDGPAVFGGGLRCSHSPLRRSPS